MGWPPRIVYKSISESAEEFKGVVSEKLIVLYSFEAALVSSFIPLGVIAIVIYNWIKTGVLNFDTINIIIFSAFIAIIIFQITLLVNRKPRMIIGRNGIWVKKGNITVSWNDMASAIIKEEHDRGTSYTLIICYYNAEKDEFYNLPIELFFLNRKGPEVAACFHHLADFL